MSFFSLNPQRLARQLYARVKPTLPKSALLPSHKLSLGKVLAFEKILVTPYQYLLQKPSGFSAHKGGPIWPAWNRQREARHCRNGHPIDDLPGSPQDKLCHLQEPAAWCGAIVNHFGHQIADFSTRILHTRTAYPKAKLLFSCQESAQCRTLAQTPAVFRSVLEWYNLCHDDIKIITEPTLVDELLVAPQAEQLINYAPSAEPSTLACYGPSLAYLDLADEHVEKKLYKRPPQTVIFVSRAGVKVHFAGEAYLEHLLRATGIKVLRPETLPLNEQLAEYASAKQLIFTEGSALYGLQLLGRAVGHVHVLARRPGFRLAENLLNARATSLQYIEVSQGLICGVHFNGNPNLCCGIPIFNEEALIEYLGAIDPRLKSRWNHAQYLEACDKDVKQWLQEKAVQTVATRPSSRENIIKGLCMLGFPHLISFAEACLPV